MKKRLLTIIAAVLGAVLLGLTVLLVVPMLINRVPAEDGDETTLAEDTTIEEETTEPIAPDQLVWRVAPTLDFSGVFHCCGQFYMGPNNWSSNIIIDPVTGRLSEGYTCGHGPMYNTHWIDPDLRIRGSGTESYSYFGFDWSSFDETESPAAALLQLARRADFSMFVEENFHDVVWNVGLPNEAFGKQYAVVSNFTHIVTEFVFDSVHHVFVQGDTIAVRQGNLWGMVGHDGNLIIPLMFEHIVRIDDQTAFAQINGRYGILDITATVQNFGR